MESRKLKVQSLLSQLRIAFPFPLFAFPLNCLPLIPNRILKMTLRENEQLSISGIEQILQQNEPLELSENIRKAVAKCRDFLDQKLKNTDQQYYGINTGFGALCNVQISPDQTQELQHRLVKSHACGAGETVPQEIVRLILLLKIKNLSLGYSGVRLELIDRLINLYNQNLLPVIFQQGSLGASGDLAPLAHLSLPLIGEGNIWYKDQQTPYKELPVPLQLPALLLQSKEGLALLNGTQFSTAYAVWALIQARKLLYAADMIAALSIDAFDCRSEPFDERLHKVRGHSGQLTTASAIRDWLKGSPLSTNTKHAVQDPYAFRCVPQVHGATKDSIEYCTTIVNRELNAVTDNPTIFPDSDGILSGGNFHAQPIALILDFMAIALSELASISERRTYQLISGQRGLPAFLSAESGLNSGLMMPQYTAASIVSQNKQLCTPASIDSIVSSNGQEDHVSMAANAGTKLYRVVHNVAQVLGVELFTASQALHFRTESTSPQLEEQVAQFRSKVPIVTEDRIFHNDLIRSKDYILGLKQE